MKKLLLQVILATIALVAIYYILDNVASFTS